MSVEAISWAFQQVVQHSSAKFVLVAMASFASTDMRCWPSSTTLAKMTGQDRKTVLANLIRLREARLIVDTGERRGGTGLVIVYQLNSTENGTVSAPPIGQNDDQNDIVNGGDSDNDRTSNGAEIWTVKQSQKRNSTENGTVPFSPANSPVFPGKQSRFSAQTVPKTGQRTVRNCNGTVIEPVETRAPRATRIPQDWMPSTDDLEFCRTSRPDLDPQRTADRFRDYWTAKSGKDAAKLDWPATWRNWVRNERAQPRASPNAYQTPNDKARAWADRLTGRTRNDRSNDPDIIDINPAPPVLG